MQYIKKFVIEHFWILIIIVLGGILYFHKIEHVPNGFYIDEALPAYNAYSILKTGKDEYGKFMPIVFRFYGSFNPPLYTYLSVIPVYIFGLNVFSGRFISVVSGLAFAVVIYLFFLATKIRDKKNLAIFGALIAIISPWIIFYSRIGYEVTLGLTLFSLGILFIWKSLSKSKYFIPGMFALSLSTYAAYTERFIVPAFVLVFLIFFRKRVFSRTFIHDFYTGVALGLITQLPNLYILFTPAFFPKTNLLAASALMVQSAKIGLYLPGILSTSLAWLREFLSQYVEYFSPKSLFFSPDPDLQRSIPAISVFYSWMIFPYLAGIYYFWKNKREDLVKFILIILFVSPVPAALTKDPFATHRALPAAFPLILLIAIGIGEIQHMINKKIFALLIGFTLFTSGIFFWRSYFVFLPQERAAVWQYGFEQLAAEIKKNPGTHYVIDQTRIKPAYINLAFYLRYPPELFQKYVDQSIKKDYYSGKSFNDHYNFGQIETRNIIWEKDPLVRQILVGDEYTISDSQAKEHGLTKVFEIRDPLQRIIFEGFETHPK